MVMKFVVVTASLTYVNQVITGMKIHVLAFAHPTMSPAHRTTIGTANYAYADVLL